MLNEIVLGVKMKAVPGYPNYLVTKSGRVWSKRRSCAGGTVAELKITNHSKHVKIADADVAWASKQVWFAKKSDKDLWCITTSVRIGKRVHVVSLHQRIMECPDGLAVDCLDGDTFNAVPDNLEIITLEENTRRQWERNRGKLEGLEYDPQILEEQLPF